MRTIKIYLLLIIGLMISVTMFAQLPISFGVKAGMNLSEIQKLDDNIKVGFNVGVTAEMDLPASCFLLSGLELTTKGAKSKEITGGAVGGSNSAKATLNAMYLQLPVHVGYKMDIAPGTKLLFHVGPYFAYGIGGKIKWDADNIEDSDFFSDNSNRFDFGVGGAIGVEFIDRIAVNLGADQGLTKVFKDTETKNRAAYLSVGYKF
ncbi:MAG: PorT family protein [Prevotella sp.]|jgi:hypothetical protein|nr:PorT family protein [Prevotella sp.]